MIRKTTSTRSLTKRRSNRSWRLARVLGRMYAGPLMVLGFFALLSASSAVVVKELVSRNQAGETIETPVPLPMLAAVGQEQLPEPTLPPLPIVDPLAEEIGDSVSDDSVEQEGRSPMDSPSPSPATLSPYPADAVLPENIPAQPENQPPLDLTVRWFNGRMVKPIKTIVMTVTAYSPDERSCAGSADNITSSLHHVSTNNFRLVAADTRVLPLGSMVSVPGYDNGQIVPVLDRGGKIKGRRLDVLFPSHEEARRFGVRSLKVVVWGYADGTSSDWRAARDGR